MPQSISDNELLARLIFSPRYCNDLLTSFNYRFITLRPNEDGISCCRFSLMTEDAVNQRGKQLARKDIYKGFALALVNDIVSIDNECVTVVATSDDHAEIRLFLDGEQVRGNTRISQLQFFFDEIRDLFLKRVVRYDG